MLTPEGRRRKMSVWDPEIELKFKHTGAQAAGEEWLSSAYELPPNEVLEIFRIEVIPPVDSDTGLIKKLRYITLVIGGNEYETLRINSIMLPAESQLNVGLAVDLGVPYLHFPITGRIPSAIEATCPKVRRGETVAVKTVADEAIASGQDYSIVLRAARVREESKLAEVMPSRVVVPSFTLNSDTYTGPAVTVTMDSFDELPGGLRQSKPQIFPWLTYARNKVASTPNTWYDLTYDSYAAYPWMQLSWNLVNKEKAYLVKMLGVIPDANSKSVRLYTEGRVTNPEFATRPLPEQNYFMPAQFYDTTVNNSLKVAGPKPLPKPYLFHGVKGGIQFIDNGSAIPIGGIELMVYGTIFVLR
jgi:hypothetical protein